ncbi:MAG: hypothetical protein KI788_09800 [Mameliella sp.]|nr:hypothetical protein [Mameliella sp.]
MSGNPIIAFGLAVSAAALAAKSGRLTLRDRLNFAATVFRQVPDDPEACAAVADFLVTVEDHPIAASAALQAFLEGWLDRISPREAEGVMQGEDAGPLFDWQGRSDLQ